MDIEKLFNDNFAKVYGFFYKKTFSVPHAEDLTSETFVRFAEKARDNSFANPENYLFGIARHVWVSFLRVKYNESTLTEEVMEGLAAKAPISESRSILMNDDMRESIEKLPPAQRQIIELRYICELSPADISTFLGKDANYVKTTHQRAIKSLRNHFGRRGQHE